jgi:hypothetical protein
MNQAFTAMSKLIALLLILSTPAEVPVLKEEMSSLTRTLFFLIRTLRNPSPHPTGVEGRKIELEFEQFKKLSHQIAPEQIGPSPGRILPMLGRPLPDQADQAYSAWKLGQYEYARGLIRTTAAACIECHSALRKGAVFDQGLDPTDLLGLTPLERARFQRALGRNDAAFHELSRALKATDWESSSWYENEEMLHELLSLEIRERKSGDRLTGILTETESKTGLPRYLRSDIRQWLEDLRRWTREKKPPNPEALLRQAFMHAEGPWDRKNEIGILRAISGLYDRLGKQSGIREADLQFQLGRAFEALSPKLQETLHERFYESCIRLSPHTPRSEECYLRLERSVILGFTGSFGTRLPEQEKKRLLELWGTAFVPGDFNLRLRK